MNYILPFEFFQWMADDQKPNRYKPDLSWRDYYNLHLNLTKPEFNLIKKIINNTDDFDIQVLSHKMKIVNENFAFYEVTHFTINDKVNNIKIKYSKENFPSELIFTINEKPYYSPELIKYLNLVINSYFEHLYNFSKPGLTNDILNVYL